MFIAQPVSRTAQSTVSPLGLSNVSANVSGLSRQHQSAQSHRGVTFGSDPIGQAFKALSIWALGLWSGIGAAIGGGVAYHELGKTTPLNQNPQVQQSLEAGNRKINDSLAKLAGITPESSPEEWAQHKALVQQVYLEHLQTISTVLTPETNDRVVLSLLKRTALSPEEVQATHELLASTNETSWQDPVQAFDTFADKVLSKHADADTVRVAKEAVRSLDLHAEKNKQLGYLALSTAILASLATAGAMGTLTVKGGAGAVPMALFAAPIMVMMLAFSVFTKR